MTREARRINISSDTKSGFIMATGKEGIGFLSVLFNKATGFMEIEEIGNDFYGYIKANNIKEGEEVTK